MSNFVIEIKAPELAHALETLAIAIGCTVDKAKLGQDIKECVKQGPSTQKKETVKENKPEEDNTPDETAEPTEPSVTVEEIRTVVSKAAKKDRAAVKKLLSKYESKNVTNLAKEHYNAFYQEVKELI